MVEIGNKKSNEFWEKHYQRSRLPADVEKEIRENFIRAKYVMRSWIPVEPDNGELLDLDHSLCKNVATDNLMKTIELLARGANVRRIDKAAAKKRKVYIHNSSLNNYGDEFSTFSLTLLLQ